MPMGDESPNGTKDAVAEARREMLRWANNSESRQRIEATLALAKHMTKISVQTSHGWDSDPWLLGVPNGVLDVRTGVLRAGEQSDKITKQTGIKYDPAAKCPLWEKFISEIFHHDEELITFVRRGLGYTLTGDLRESCWFGCYGTGGNGKSTLFKTLHLVFGDYGYVAPFSLVERGSGDGRRDFDIAYLQNMRFVMASEVREGGVWDEERLKRLSGGDALHAEIKHGAEYWFLPSHKLWFMFNHQPRVRDHSVGFWRRVRLIPFTENFEGPRRDNLLDVKLRAELGGILTWLVNACREWYAHGLYTPKSVIDASRRYESDEDPLTGFIARHLRLDGQGFSLAGAYALYREWTKIELVEHPLGRTRFSIMLESKGFKRSARKDAIMFESGRLVKTCVCMKTPCVC